MYEAEDNSEEMGTEWVRWIKRKIRSSR